MPNAADRSSKTRTTNQTIGLNKVEVIHDLDKSNFSGEVEVDP